MTNGSPKNDDGETIRTKMGRPRKGDLTDQEFIEVAWILAKPRKARGGSLQAAANRVSELRGANAAVDPRTRETRTVSARWVTDQLNQRGIAGKSGLRGKVAADPLWLGSGAKSDSAAHSGSRVIPELPPDRSAIKIDEARSQEAQIAAPAIGVDAAQGERA